MKNAKAIHLVKVLLDVDRDDGEHDVESVWAAIEEMGYRIDNIPFYARGFAYGDIVSAVPEPDGLLRCTGVLIPSGHSTIRLWFANECDVHAVRDELRALRCDSELDIPRLVAVDIPPYVPYAQIRKYLDDHERLGIFEYEEGCLAQVD